MSAIICPTVMGSSSKEYRESIERVSEFAERIHIDFADGIFAPTKLEPIEDAWWPIGLIVDFHIMYKKPMNSLEVVINHQPHLAIIHAEADDALNFIKELKGFGINRGVALLKDTKVDYLIDFIEDVEHVLIFSGELGYYGGKVDLSLLDKVKKLKEIKPNLEIGWDGGINKDNVKLLIDGGVDILNVGGAIQKSADPENAYDILKKNIT